MLKKSLISFLALTIFAGIILVVPSFATVRCETQYGGGQTCVRTGQLLVNKKVWDPDNNSFVDNLSVSSHIFDNGEEVTFTFDIKNVGDATLTNVTYSDTLPANLSWSGGDSLSGTIGSLDVGQIVTKTVKAKVSGVNSLVCELNAVTTTASDNASDRDTAQVCLESKVKAITTIPQTGPEHWLLLYSALPALGAVGYLIRRKAKLVG